MHPTSSINEFKVLVEPEKQTKKGEKDENEGPIMGTIAVFLLRQIWIVKNPLKNSQ